MHKNRRVAVVIPAYNEELLIEKAVRTIPDLVDTIIVVNDASRDRTEEVLADLQATIGRLVVINLEVNRGIGGALKTGYRWVLDNTNADLIGTLAGDAQCDPDYVAPMLEQQARDGCDFVKASRFRGHAEALRAMPAYRRIGNRVISKLTALATGYHQLTDSQNGYGFFTRDILERIDWSIIGERYDYENTMLIALSLQDARITEIGAPAIYGDEISGIKFLPTTARALQVVAWGASLRLRNAVHRRIAPADPYLAVAREH